MTRSAGILSGCAKKDEDVGVRLSVGMEVAGVDVFVIHQDPMGHVRCRLTWGGTVYANPPALDSMEEGGWDRSTRRLFLQ